MDKRLSHHHRKHILDSLLPLMLKGSYYASVEWDDTKHSYVTAYNKSKKRGMVLSTGFPKHSCVSLVHISIMIYPNSTVPFRTNIGKMFT